MKKIYITISIITIFFIASCQDNSKPLPQKKNQESAEQLENKINESTVLQINNINHTNKDLKKFINIQYHSISAKDQDDKLYSRIFDSFVEHKLILFKADAEKIKIDQDEIKEYLEKLNVSLETIDQDAIKNTIKVQKYLYFQIYKDIDVKENEIKEYYQNNLEEFRKNDQVLLYHIMSKDKEKAIKIRGILKNHPHRFAQIAARESSSLDGKQKGLMGYFEKGTLPKEMEDVVFSLRINEISPIVETPYGFHIFKVTKRKRRRLLYYSAVKEEIKNKLLSEKLRLAYNEFLNILKEELNIKINIENLYFTYIESQQGDK